MQLPRAERDRLIGAPPRTPGSALVAAVLSTAVAAAFAGCSRSANDGAPAATGADGAGADAPVIGHGETYERAVLFMDTSRDTSMFVQWEWEARNDSAGVRRAIRGWLGRTWSTPELGDDARDGGEWDHFISEEWTSPHGAREWWRIRPRGRVRLVVGHGNVLREVYYQEPEPARFLSVVLGESMAEWRGRQGGSYRVLRGRAMLWDSEMAGLVLDASYSRDGDAEGQTEWALLAGPGELVLLVANSGRSDREYRAWALLGSEESSWSEVKAEWVEAMALEGGGRTVPLGWRLASEDGELRGELESTKASVRSLTGDSAEQSVLEVHEVAGQVAIAGTRTPVRGFLRHFRR